jgi:hypothetical protein
MFVCFSLRSIKFLQNLVLNEIAEKHFKHTAAKTCNIKSENQVKGKVKAKTTTTVLTNVRHNVQNVGRDF